MSATRSIIAGLLLGISGGCITIPPASLSMSKEELIANDELKRERSKILEMSLEDKIKLVERDIDDSFVKIGEGILSPIYSTKSGPGPLHLEHNALLLSALSAKYAVTQDPKTKETANALIRGLIELDSLNGFDGYIPLMVDPVSKKCTPLTTHANAYDQLFFAYLHYSKKIGENPDIKKHVSIIYKKFSRDNFELRHTDGSLINDADLNRDFIDFRPSRSLDRRVLDSIGFLLGDDATKKKVSEERWNGICVSPNRLDIVVWQIPTTSSSWLNVLKFNILTECGKDYRSELVSLAQDYTEMENPFFKILAHMADNAVDISSVERRLKEFPYPVSDEIIVNSHRKDITFRGKRFIKGKTKKETTQVLPLYEIGSDSNLWKRNLLEADRKSFNLGRKYFGVDLLQAYWFYEAIKKKNE
jgi:hypothetical protein